MDESGKPIKEKHYRGIIRSLLYLTTSRPNIICATYLCARFQSCSKKYYLNAIKIIFKYLISTLHLGLWYPRNTSFDLINYSNAEFISSL